jgi:hypothetical protein
MAMLLNVTAVLWLLSTVTVLAILPDENAVADGQVRSALSDQAHGPNSPASHA